MIVSPLPCFRLVPLEAKRRTLRDLKPQVSKLPFFTMKFTVFWTYMIIHYNDEVRFKNVLMVVLVVLLLILDTSCAERGTPPKPEVVGIHYYSLGQIVECI